MPIRTYWASVGFSFSKRFSRAWRVRAALADEAWSVSMQITKVWRGPACAACRYAACSWSRESDDVVDRSGGIAGKRRDLLLDTIFQDLEIRRMKPADVVTFLVGYDHWYQHLLNVEPDSGFLLGDQAPGRDEENRACCHDRVHATIVTPFREVVLCGPPSRFKPTSTRPRGSRQTLSRGPYRGTFLFCVDTLIERIA